MIKTIQTIIMLALLLNFTCLKAKMIQELDSTIPEDRYSALRIVQLDGK